LNCGIELTGNVNSVFKLGIITCNMIYDQINFIPCR
jgi:hypothetical protein